MSMSIAKFGGKILENKAFLYVCFLISTFSLIFFAKAGDAVATALFLFSGYFVSLFTKKMAIVLILALVVSFLYRARFMISRKLQREGMENSLDDVKTGVDKIRTKVAAGFETGFYDGVKSVEAVVDAINLQKSINSMVPSNISKTITDGIKNTTVSETDYAAAKTFFDGHNISINDITSAMNNGNNLLTSSS